MSTEELSDSLANLYPIALDLRGRRCVVVGGGTVAARKAEGLLAANAIVVVVAPVLSDSLRELSAAGRVDYVAARFAPAHLDGAFLAVAATDDASVNRTVGAAARERGVLWNRAGATDAVDTASDDAEGGDFVTMATVRRGDLLLAITTGGAGPALAARLRRELEARFGPEWAAYVALLREMRDMAKVRLTSDRRSAALRRLAGSEGVLIALQNGDSESARREALSCLS